MEDIRRVIVSRINNFEILLPEHLTPLLRKQINHAIELHRDALNNPDPYLKDLDALYDQFNEHWTKVYGDTNSRAFLLRDIILFHRFLVGKLLEDYTNEPCTINEWVLDQAKCMIEQEGHTGAKDGSNVGTAYSVHVIYPLEEMMLSRDYVENKLRAVAAGQGRQGSDIQLLINKCDWSNLATALTDDRDLAHKLFLEQPFNTNIFDANAYKRILRGIDEIEGKYFAKLSDSPTLTNSPHTREMSAGQASNHTNHRSPPTPQTISPSNTRHHPKDRSSRNSFGWNIYNAFASGLGGTISSLKSRPSPLSSDADWDEATSHINSKKAE
jgi:hypothetical protein